VKIAITNRILKGKYTEVIIWASGLVFLFISVRFGLDGFTVCPLKLAGFDHCPGCGLGTSVGLLLNGRLTESFQAHPLGILALIILTIRIISLIIKNK